MIVKKNSLKTLNDIGWSILKFGGSFAVYSLIGIPAMLGALMLNKTISIFIKRS